MSPLGTVSCGTAQGPRSYQEDRFVAHAFSFPGDLSGYLLAVMDGHGGVGAAEICARRVPELFQLKNADDLRDSLRRVISALSRETEGLRSGTTVSLACVLESHGKAAVAVLGDSPVVAVDREAREIVGPEHNVRTNLEERTRAEARGGTYQAGYICSPRTGDGLQVSRALGDAGLSDILDREPEVFSLDIGADSVVVVASDGILDPGHSNGERLIREMLDLRGATERFDAGALLAWAERRGLLDNATVLMWKGSG